MSSGTAKGALILAALAMGKSFNVLGGQPPLPVPTPSTTNYEPRMLRGNFSITRGTGTSGNFGLNPAQDDFAQPFNPTAGWGSAVVRYPFTRIGLRALISGPLASGGSSWLFYAQAFVASLGTYVTIPAQVQIALSTTSQRILDTGLVAISSLAIPGFTQLTPGVDIVTLGETFVISGVAQTMVGHVEIYGGM